MPDHVHLLVGWRTDATVADLLRNVRSRSSYWVNQTFDGSRFGWQDGYGAFSVSQSRVGVVGRCIETQAEHRRERSFEEEFLFLLRAHGVEFDPRYVFA